MKILSTEFRSGITAIAGHRGIQIGFAIVITAIIAAGGTHVIHSGDKGIIANQGIHHGQIHHDQSIAIPVAHRIQHATPRISLISNEQIEQIIGKPIAIPEAHKPIHGQHGAQIHMASATNAIGHKPIRITSIDGHTIDQSTIIRSIGSDIVSHRLIPIEIINQRGQIIWTGKILIN